MLRRLLCLQNSGSLAPESAKIVIFDLRYNVYVINRSTSLQIAAKTYVIVGAVARFAIGMGFC